MHETLLTDAWKFLVTRNNLKMFDFFVFGSYLVFNSKHNQKLKKASTKVSFRAQNLLRYHPWISEHFYYSKKCFRRKKNTYNVKTGTFFGTLEIQKQKTTCSHKQRIKTRNFNILLCTYLKGLLYQPRPLTYIHTK